MINITATAVLWVLFAYYTYSWRQDHRWLKKLKRFRRHSDDVDAILNHWYMLLTMFVVFAALTVFIWV